MYWLSKFENNKFETIRLIKESSFIQLKNDCRTIHESYTQFVVFKYLQLNLKDYLKFINKSTKIITNEIDVRKLMNPHFILEVNKLVLNLLSSFKFFIDNGETFIKRTYGKQSMESHNYSNFLSSQYDNLFGYRFLYKLRNYSIHLGFPIEYLSYENINRPKNPREIFCEIPLKIETNKLKKEIDLFGKKIISEIENMGDEIDIRPLIVELSTSILDIQYYIFSLYNKKLKLSINNIEQFIGNHKNDSNDIIVCYNFKSKKDISKFNSLKVPFEMISDFRNYMNQKHIN